jgi:hypothetical protein
VALGVADGVGKGATDGDALGTPVEGAVTGFVEGDATWLEVQPPSNPATVNTTIAFESFMCFITLLPLSMPCADRQVGRQTRTTAIPLPGSTSNRVRCPIPDTEMSSRPEVVRIRTTRELTRPDATVVRNRSPESESGIGVRYRTALRGESGLARRSESDESNPRVAAHLVGPSRQLAELLGGP